MNPHLFALSICPLKSLGTFYMAQQDMLTAYVSTLNLYEKYFDHERRIFCNLLYLNATYNAHEMQKAFADLSPADRPIYAARLTNVLTSWWMVVSILRELAPDTRLTFATQMLDRISSIGEISAVISTLTPVENKFKFIEIIRPRIQSNLVWTKIASQFQGVDLVRIVQMFIQHVPDLRSLNHLVEAADWNQDDSFEFICQFKTILSAGIVELNLSADAFDEKSMSDADYRKVVLLFNMTPKKLHLPLVIINNLKFNLAQFKKRLPQARYDCNQLLGYFGYLINSAADIIEIVEGWITGEVFDFVHKHRNLFAVDSINNIPRLLTEIKNGDVRAEVAKDVSTQAQMNAELLSAVTKLLSEGKRNEYLKLNLPRLNDDVDIAKILFLSNSLNGAEEFFELYFFADITELKSPVKVQVIEFYNYLALRTATSFHCYLVFVKLLRQAKSNQCDNIKNAFIEILSSLNLEENYITGLANDIPYQLRLLVIYHELPRMTKFDSMYNLISILTPEHREVYVRQLIIKHEINSIDKLVSIVKLVGLEHKSKYALKFKSIITADVIREEPNNNRFFKPLVAEQTAAAIKFSKQETKNLCKVLEELPETERYAYLEACGIPIEDRNDLLIVANLMLPRHRTQLFLNRINRNISCRQLCPLVAIIPPEEQLHFVRQYHSVLTFENIQDILSSLHHSKRLSFALEYIQSIRTHLQIKTTMLTMQNFKDREQLFKETQHQPKNCSELVELLEIMFEPGDARVAYAEEYAALITNAYDLGKVLDKLPTTTTYLFALKYKKFIVEPAHVVFIAMKLPAYVCVEFVEKLIPRVRAGLILENNPVYQFLTQQFQVKQTECNLWLLVELISGKRTPGLNIESSSRLLQYLKHVENPTILNILYSQFGNLVRLMEADLDMHGVKQLASVEPLSYRSNNLLEILQSPTKHAPDAVKNLLEAGITIENMLNAQSTKKLTNILRDAETVKKVFLNIQNPSKLAQLRKMIFTNDTVTEIFKNQVEGTLVRFSM